MRNLKEMIRIQVGLLDPLNKRALNMRFLLLIFLVVFTVACEKQNETKKKLSSFKEVEKEILDLNSESIPDPKERVYKYFYQDKDLIYDIAHGEDISNADEERIVRKMAWVIMAEMQERFREIEFPNTQNIPNLQPTK